MNRKLSALAIVLLIGISVFGQADIKSETLKKHVFYLASDELEGRGLGTESGMTAANYIADYFKKVGLKPIGESYFHPFYARVGQSMLEGRNVVGMIEGSDPVLKNEFIVLGAHFDHVSYKFKDGVKVVYNGADDNASGTSAIMEIGRALVKEQKNLKRSVILVAFDGEESGLIGSGKFVKNETVPVDQIKAMMSIDMIGRYAESNSLIMGAMDMLKGGTEQLLIIAEKRDIKIKKTGGDVMNRTDTKPFGDVGIPSIYVTTGIIGPYHKPEDDAETLDYEGMEMISNMLVELTLELADFDALIPINQLTAQAKQKGGLPFFRYGATTNIGTSFHTYTDDFFRSKSKFSSEIGLMTQFKITKNFSLQPEVLYSTMGSKSATGNFRTHSVITPISLIIASNMEGMAEQRFFAKIGGYYSYNFAGAVDGESMDFSNTYNQTETGIIYGIGLEAMSFFISVNFKHGLTGIKQEINTLFRNRATYFTLGYMF